MPIPPFHEMLLPLLRRSGDGREWTVAALRAPIADDFALTDPERQELLPSNTQSRFVNRLCWAKIYLERAGLITRVRRGVFTISAAGRAVLAENPAAITLAYLDRFESFRKFRETRTTDDGTAEPADPQPAVETPDAVLEKAHEALNDELATQLLDEIADRSPLFFEKVVLDLMRAMGYGGWGDAAGRLTGKGADEGIDGIIHEDRLGLDTIYLQAKRWDHSVGRPPKIKVSLTSSWAPSTAAGPARECSSPRARSRATRSNTPPRSTPRCAHTTTTLAAPDSLGRWTFSIGNGGTTWAAEWIKRSWRRGAGGLPGRRRAGRPWLLFAGRSG